MLIRLANGRVVDPASGRDAIGDVYIRDSHVDEPRAGETPDATYDLSGKVVMAGAIDVHSHIAGGNVGIARFLLPELCISETRAPPDAPLATARWSAVETGRLYAEMGFTTVVEPAVPPLLALRTHLEFEDIPIIDRAGLVVLGNDAFLLDLLRRGESPQAVRDYVGLMLDMAGCLGVKIINAGGAAAFKENVRSFDLDDVVPAYGVSSRAILMALHEAVEALGVPHPAHVHCNNLGIPGAADTLAATAQAADGRPMHFAHVQFYAYDRARRGIRSAGARLVEALSHHPNITIDVGQVMFGQTATVSLDVLRQFSARSSARPRKWVLWEGYDEGAGILPFNYRAADPTNALQWAAGLEIFLLAQDPWRVFLTTDHPNGARFTTYPQILHLLMDAGERARWMETLPASVKRRTSLASLQREYTLNEVAVMTRAAPARLLGLKDRGHLAPGALADVAVYADLADRTAMFRAADMVFKSGELVVRGGKVVSSPRGRTQVVRPGYDRQIGARFASHVQAALGVGLEAFTTRERQLGRPDVFQEHPCRR